MATATASAREVQLHWCRWFHCESSFNLSLVPDEPGLFVVAQEEDGPQKRMTLVKIKAAESLFHALNHLFAAGCPLRESLEKRRCFLRYAVEPDVESRQAALAALEYWVAAPDAVRSRLVDDFLAANGSGHPFRDRED